MDTLTVKTVFYSVCATIGGVMSALFGGLDMALVTLLIFMGIDYVTGLIVAGVFHRSGKSESGSLESGAGWKGLLRKGVTLLVVLVAARLDIILETSFIRDAATIAYTANEALSIIENAGLMGIPIPEPVKNAVEALKTKKKGDEKDD